VVPEYVLRIVPKRKDKYLLRGQIWVDANTFRIRRMEVDERGVQPTPRFLLQKFIRISQQFHLALCPPPTAPIGFHRLLVTSAGFCLLSGFSSEAE
jgi:hypothetical protein